MRGQGITVYYLSELPLKEYTEFIKFGASLPPTALGLWEAVFGIMARHYLRV